MANDKHWQLGLPSNSSQGSSRSSNRKNRDDNRDRHVDDNAGQRDDEWKRPEESWRSRPEQSGRHRDEASRRSRPRKEARSRDVDDEWKHAEKNWKPPLEASASYRDNYDDNDGGSRQRSGDSHRSRPEYRDYHPYPESSERQGRNSGNLPPRYDGYDEPARSSSSGNRRSQFDEPEKTRPSLWGDESELQPAVSPLWAGDPVARRESSRPEWSPRFDESKRKHWWRLPHFKDPYDRRRSILWSVGVGLLILACILPSLTFVGVFTFYKHASSLATEGVAHLEQGGNLLKELATKGNINASVTSEALQNFEEAHSDFSQLQSSVGQIPGFAGGVPKFGSEIASAEQLVPIAVEASQMAVLGTNALNILLADISNPFAKTGSGLTTNDMGTIDSDFTQVVALFNTLAAQIRQLSPASLTFNAKLGADIVKVKAELPKAQKYIQLADQVLSLLPSLLGVGTPAYYLIEVLDSTELRPGGGFLGNFGVLKLSGGRKQGLTITDVDLLDRDQNEHPIAQINFPQQYQWFATAEGQTSWGLRDSNMEADFPTDAQYAEWIYAQEAPVSYQYELRLHQENPQKYSDPKTPPVPQFQGVIAITPFLIQNLIKNITGPIAVPGYKTADGKIVTVNSTNMIDIIHTYQLGAGHGSGVQPAPGTTTSQRKAFTAALFNQLMAKVVSLSSTKRAAFIGLAVNSLQNKDLQIYLGSAITPPGTATPPSLAETLLKQFHDASTIQAPPTGDSLFIVDANVTGNKQSLNINYTATDNISIDEQGNVTHDLTLTYDWPLSAASSANTYGGNNDSIYTDHVRVYAPIKSQLMSYYAPSGEWTYDDCRSGYVPCTDYGLQVFTSDLNMYYQQEGVSITYIWTVPGAAVKSGQSWSYQLLFQRQAGITWSQTTTIDLPSCAKVTSHTKQLKSGPKNTVTVTASLTTDTTYAVQYTCAS